MPSGIVSLYRRLCPCCHSNDKWAEAFSTRSSVGPLPPSPVRIKLRADNERQLEVKIVYAIGDPHGPARSRAFKVEAFFFVDATLFSEHPTLEFFSNLYGVVRLHTPRTTLAQLADRTTPGAPLAMVAQAVATAVAASSRLGAAIDVEAGRYVGGACGGGCRCVTHCLPGSKRSQVRAAKEAAAAAADDAANALRLHACMFRAAVRREASAAAAALRHAVELVNGGGGDDAALTDAAAAAVDLVRVACEALEGLATAAEPLEAAGIRPFWLTEAWQMVDESVLLEGERSFLKLLVAVGPRGAPPPAAPAFPPSSFPSPIARAYSFRGMGPDAERLDVSSSMTFADGRVGVGAPPVPPPPRDPPRPPPAGWAGRYPHLDAVRSAAVMKRRSLEETRSSSVGGSTTGGDSPRGASPPRTRAVPRFSLGHPLSPIRSADGEATSPVTRPDAAVRALLREAVAGLEAARVRRGFLDSLMRDGPPSANETYTNRLQLLKKHARAAITLHPKPRPPSNLLADFVGATVAAAAMGFALWTVWLSQRKAPSYSALYLALLIGGYVVKDRMKEWGKRYLQPVAEWCGAWFPDRRVRLSDARGAPVGTMAERVTLTDPAAVNPRVLALRHEGSTLGSHARAAAQPERVIRYEKRVRVAWRRVDPRLRSVTACSDIMRFDLSPLTRRMQPPLEAHARLRAVDAVSGDGDGTTAEPVARDVEAVSCARVYHVNLVLRIRAADAGASSVLRGGDADRDAGGGVMLLERARVVMNQGGIVRLEPAGRSRFAAVGGAGVGGVGGVIGKAMALAGGRVSGRGGG